MRKTRASAILLSTLVSVGVGGPAQADEGLADMTVTIDAERHILAPSGWSRLDVDVRNDGSAPAEGVTVSLTLPAGFGSDSLSSSSAWECDWATLVVTCVHEGDFPAGHSDRVIELSVSAEHVTPGDTPVATATATSTSGESNTANNTATRTYTIVGTGTLAGNTWNDLNADGIRQPGEPAATSVGVGIRAIDDYDTDGFANNHDMYWRYTKPAKRYILDVSANATGWRLTTPGVGPEDSDSDFTPTGGSSWQIQGKSDPVTVVAGATTTVDAGFVAAFRPTALTPVSGRRGSLTTVTLTGAHFATGRPVRLERPGQDPIAGRVLSVSPDNTTMRVAFRLVGAELGEWSLTMGTPGGPYAVLPDAFTVRRPISD
ncbi:MAG TPA: hypothetical protein VF755_05250 [Catenuloplanes sp.]